MGRRDREQEIVLPPGFNVVFPTKDYFSVMEPSCLSWVCKRVLSPEGMWSLGAGELLGEGRDSKLTLGCGLERMKGWRIVS